MGEEKILDVNDNQLDVRIEVLKKRLLEASKSLRAQIDPNLGNQDLTTDGVFKQWVICNTVLDACINDEDNSGFNRMLMFLFENSKGNIARVLSNYDLNIKINDKDELEEMNLVVLETENNYE